MMKAPGVTIQKDKNTLLIVPAEKVFWYKQKFIATNYNCFSDWDFENRHAAESVSKRQ